MAESHEADGAELYEKTGGNPFYVTEALIAGGRPSDSVRDAVLARVARFSAAERALLEAVAVVPPRIELDLLEAVAGGDLAGLECGRRGDVAREPTPVGFRHEIVRVVIEEALSPSRSRELHGRTLSALLDRAGEPTRRA